MSTDPRYILALDQGTTSSRALLIDREGRLCGLAQREFSQHYPQPGWVEHDAEEIWQTQLTVARAVLREKGVDPRQIAAIGIANQRETTVLWDRRSGCPLHRAIVWQDRRTADCCERLRLAGHEELFQNRTGLLLDAYFSGSKLQWLLDQLPQARQRAERGELAFGTIDSWLSWRLSGGQAHVTDPSNASRTLLFDIQRGEWNADLLALFNIPPSILPRVVDSSGTHAHTAPEWFGAAIPIASLVGDQQAATFGQACLEAGMAKNTYGTSCFMLLNTGQQRVPSRHRLLTTSGWRRDGRTTYLLEGSVFMAGATVQWLRDELGLIEHAADIESLAASVPDSGGVYLVPAHTGLAAPYWDPYARGALLGLTRGSNRAHIARATLEAIAFQSAEVLQAMENDAGTPLRELRVDGGAVKNDLLLQFQADLLGIPVVRPRITETTALGAAYLAGLGVGFWHDDAEIAALWQEEKRFEPQSTAVRRKELLAGWRHAVGRCRDWLPLATVDLPSPKNSFK